MLHHILCFTLKKTFCPGMKNTIFVPGQNIENFSKLAWEDRNVRSANLEKKVQRGARNRLYVSKNLVIPIFMHQLSYMILQDLFEDSFGSLAPESKIYIKIILVIAT